MRFPTEKNISDCDENIETVCKRHVCNKRYLFETILDVMHI